jgi:transposase-like protein
MKLDDPEQLDEYLRERKGYSPDFKALVLRLYHERNGDAAGISLLTNVPLRTIYSWVDEWNRSGGQKKKG